jgi:hypothetical protein
MNSRVTPGVRAAVALQNPTGSAKLSQRAQERRWRESGGYDPEL